MKKITALTLIVVLICCTGIPVTASDNTNYEESVLLLEKLGVIQSGGLAANSIVTRAAAAKIMVTLMGFTNVLPKDTAFTDVDSSNENSGYIAIAYDMGLMSGFDDGSFLPNEPVTYHQVIKVLISLLGYGEYAENYGGYPAGYLVIASQKKLHYQGSDGPITFGMAAKLIESAFDVELMTLTKYGGGKKTYTEEKGVTLLSKYHEIYKYEGLVTANYYTALVNDTPLKKGQVAIDGTVFNAGDTDAESLLCKNVTTYVRKTDDTGTILYIAEKSVCTELTVNGNEILDQTTKAALKYERDGKTETAPIQNEATLILNGGLKYPWTEKDLMPAQGNVTLIAPNGGRYEYILVWEYENLIVDSVDKEEEIIYFKEGGSKTSLAVSESAKGTKIRFLEASLYPTTIDVCYEWDVLSVSESQDGSVLNIIRSERLVTGEISEISGDEAVIDGKVYEISKDLTQPKPYLGLKADFYLDYTGKIAAVDISYANPYQYGWYVGGELSKGVEREPQLQIFTEEGKMILTGVTKKITLNGFEQNNILAALGGKQLIRYEMAGGRVSAIETARDFTGDYNNPTRQAVFSRDYYINESKKVNGETVDFIGGTMMSFGTKFLVRDKTKVFVIPGADSPPSDYILMDPKLLAHAGNYTKVTLFDTDENDVVGAMVWDCDDTSGVTASYPAYTATCGIITDISKGIDENGDNTTILKVYTWSGAEEKLVAPSDFKVLFGASNTDIEKDKIIIGKVKPTITAMDKLSRGDVIQYQLNASRDALAVLSVLYRAESPGFFESVVSEGNVTGTGLHRNYYGALLTASYKISEVTKYGIRTNINSYNPATMSQSDNIFARVYPFGGKQLLYDMSTNRLTSIDRFALKEGDAVFSLFRTNSQMFMIVYRNDGELFE